MPRSDDGADVPGVRWGSDVAARRLGTHRVRVLEPRPGCLGEVVDEAVATWADREYLVQGRTRVTFAQLGRAIDTASRRLESAGVGPGDRVAILAANSPSWVIAFLAVLRGGAVCVLANGWWTPGDVEHALHETEVRVVLADARRAARVPEGVAKLDIDALSSAAVAEPGPFPRAQVNEDDPAYVVFTSGSTARPKAALLSHRSTVANLHNLLVRTNQLPPLDTSRPPGVNLCAVPLFHISGVQTILQHLVVGGRLVFLDGRFDAGEVLDLIESEHATSWTAVPTMLTMVLEHPSVARRDLSSVRSLAVGGAPIPPGLLDRAREVFVGASRRMAVSYGSTEAGGTVATGLAADAGGAMLPLSTCEVRLGSPDDAGVGEILVRSPTLMDRYLGVPDDEQPVDADGWLHTGDLGVLDAEGRLRVVGRTKDVVIRGGENVSAGYVEDALKAHPGVADVAVVGIEHPTWGEEVAASIRVVPTSDPTPEELRAFLDGRIAAFAVPTRWRISEASLPLTETGKVDKVAVRQGFEEPDERAR